MSLTAKALFVIERSLDGDLTLEEIAQRCGVSRFHLSHAFGRATGMPPMAYVRARRLSDAARALIAGAPDILGLALDSGYASHEAFSRAFKSQFGKTPEEARHSGAVSGLVDARPQQERGPMKLSAPDIRQTGELRFVGAKRHTPFSQIQTVPEQWRRFMAESYADIAHKIPGPPVGLYIAMTEEGFDYVCAAEVSRFDTPPPGCETFTLAPTVYAVFSHDANIALLSQTFRAIWDEYLPGSGRKPAEAPTLERYKPAFDPRTGDGGVEVWVALSP
jgi:AraC family transcriptional regulator